MSKDQDKQAKKAAKAALKAQKKKRALPSAGGVLPPPPEERPWYRDANWVRTFIAALTLLLGVYTIYATRACSGSSEASGQTGPDNGLSYLIEVVGGDDAPDLPIIVGVHGLGDGPDGFKRLFADLPFPARVIVPRAPQSYSRGYSWFPTTIRDGKVTRLDTEVMLESAARLALLCRSVQERWPMAGPPVLTGFSQGGILSYLVAVNHPSAIAGAVPVSGLIPPALYPSKGPDKADSRTIVGLHGRADTLVPFDGARETVETLKKLGFEARLDGFDGVGHTISREMRKRLFDMLARILEKRAASYSTSAIYAAIPNSSPVAVFTN